MPSDTAGKIELWDVSNHEYQATKEWLGNSALNLFLEDAWLFHLWERGEYSRKPTEAMRIGSGTDAILSGTFAEECAVTPSLNLHTKSGREEKAMFEFQNRHKTILSPAEYEQCCAMADAVRSNEEAMSLLGSPGKWQVSARWRTKSGQGLKVRFDYLLDSGDEVQLKTRHRPKSGRDSLEDWKKKMLELGYYRNAALYTIARRKLGLGGLHYFVTVYNEPPYDANSVFVYETDESWIQAGKAHLSRILADLKRRRAENDWKPSGGGKILRCVAPDWFIDELSALMY